MRPRLPGSAAGAAIAALSLAAIGAGAARDRALPPIVFVSRGPAAAGGVVPGLGPAGRAVRPGGRLLLRERSGRIRGLLPDGALWDVCDPSVSFDARTVVFAGTPDPDSGWRLYRVGIDGRGFEPLPVPPVPGADDLDPCWIGPASLVFASTRERRIAQYARVPVTNLYRWDGDGATPRRLTHERNGAEEPAWDPGTGRVLFSRWWFNRHQPADSGGLVAVRAGDPRAERANLWHVMSIPPEGGEARLAAGDLRARRTAMGYQPAPLAKGGIAAVFASVTGLHPSGGAYGIQRLDRAGGASARIAGVALEPDAPVAYGSPGGLAAPAACAPAALPDGRVVFAFDPSGRGDFGLVVADPDGRGRSRVVDLPGTLELDPAPVIARRARGAGPVGAAFPGSAATATFRYLNRDVFAGRGAPARVAGSRIRFYAAVDRPLAEGGDSAVLVRERPVGRDGRVDERGLPAGTPMFESLIDARGRVLTGPLGPAHVSGLNVGPAGATLECRGCHVGHSRRR